ncbi:MAG: hypothetical protein B7Z71_13290, partial [Acidocella sp. 21-58-7]
DLLLTKAALQAGEAILDVGCGTGPTSIRAARQLAANGSVTGIDISETMLNVARQNTAGQNNLEFLLADAETYRFHPASYNALISRFGNMFFGNPVAAFSNLRTSLTLGGRICFICWAPLSDNPHWHIPFEIVTAALGPAAPRPPHAPGPMAFADPTYVHGIMADAGFTNIAITPHHVPIIGNDIETESQIACSLGPASALLDEKQANPATRMRLREEISSAFTQFDQADGLKLPATIFVITATNG